MNEELRRNDEDLSQGEPEGPAGGALDGTHDNSRRIDFDHSEHRSLLPTFLFKLRVIRWIEPIYNKKRESIHWERELLERERELLRQEQQLVSRMAPNISESVAADNSFSGNGGIQVIEELLRESDGSDSNFQSWKQ